MKRIRVEVNAATAARLDELGLVGSRERSAFIRAAIRRALSEFEEQATEAAYRRQPDSEPVYFDASVWEAREPQRTRSRRSRD